MAELKPCPFCGGEAIRSNGHGEPIIWVNHKRGCFLGELVIRDFDESVSAWNRRATPDAEAIRDAMRRAADGMANALKLLENE